MWVSELMESVVDKTSSYQHIRRLSFTHPTSTYKRTQPRLDASGMKKPFHWVWLRQNKRKYSYWGLDFSKLTHLGSTTATKEIPFLRFCFKWTSLEDWLYQNNREHTPKNSINTKRPRQTQSPNLRIRVRGDINTNTISHHIQHLNWYPSTVNVANIPLLGVEDVYHTESKVTIK